MKTKRAVICIVLILCISISNYFTSCITTKTVTYFNNLPDSQYIRLDSLVPPQQFIQVNDLLEIKVGGENEKTVQYLNNYTGLASNLTSGVQQYLVDLDGNLDLPKLGKIKAKGFSKDQLRDTLVRLFAVYLKEPIVTIKFSNFKFSVMGEVRGPGNYTVTAEKVSLFEALSQAGEMTEYSRRDNVKIIRDIGGKREIISVNFNDKSILNSPNYYLNRYDILYVEPYRSKQFYENIGKTATIVGTISGILALLFVLIKK